MATHAPFSIEPVGDRYVAKCVCCWKTGSRRTASIARKALEAHIREAPAIDTHRQAKRDAAAEACE